MVEEVKADPVRLGAVTCFMVDCLRDQYYPDGAAAEEALQPPTSPTISEAETLFLELSNDSDARTVVAPDLISKYEMKFWYHGVSGDPPKLLWRSDLETNPFPIPWPGTKFFKIPTKTAHGVFNTPLNAVWANAVAPRILASMKARGLKYSAVKTARFAIVEDGKDETRPRRCVDREILQILADVKITDVVVEWYEGSVVNLVGRPLMRVEARTNPMFGLNDPFNSGLGIPIARQSDHVQGTLTLLFKEVATSSGDPSDRILGLTSKHVASVDTTIAYELDAANPEHILVCGDRRLALAVTEIKGAVSKGFRDAIRLAGEVKDFEALLGTPQEDKRALKRTKNALDEKNEDNATLQILSAEVNAANWKDPDSRRFGVVDWAPEISVTADERPYTRDIATFAVNAEKLVNFERNIIDLGNQYSAGELEELFWPLATVREGRKIPANLQLPARTALTRRRVMNHDTEDKNGEPLYIVGKYGNTTKLTLGRYSGMEAYTCTDLGVESREVVVYNYSKTSGDFSNHGDSGSLIFTGDGDALAMLHSGMPRGLHNHVTYGTPFWWVIKQILVKYPSPEFYGITYSLD